MRSPSRSTYVMGGLVLLLLLIVAATLLGGRNLNWKPHYRSDKTDPYGTKVLREVLHHRTAPHAFRVGTTAFALPADTLSGPASYVFVGQGILLPSVAIDQLLDFVGRGNHAFIASQVFPRELMVSLSLTEYVERSVYDSESEVPIPQGREYLLTTMDTAVQLQLTHPHLRLPKRYEVKYLYRHEAQYETWRYFGRQSLPSPSPFEVAGTFRDSLANFIRVPFGEGFFYFHSIPMAFTNFYLVQEEGGLAYAERVLGHLPEGPVYWDDHSRVSAYTAEAANRGPSTLPRQGPLQYILAEPPLALAWYILLGAGLLFMVFRARRRQRVIPVPVPNLNTSLAFVQTIGRMYFLQGNHRQLALHKMRFFQIFVRERYRLAIADWDDEAIAKLAARSQVDEDHIRRLVRLHTNILSSRMTTENTLADFYRLVEGFYQRCR